MGLPCSSHYPLGSFKQQQIGYVQENIISTEIEESQSFHFLMILLNNNVQQPGLNVITELIIGYMYPGKPLANVTFKTYGYISMSQALTFVSDFKLGHYMKIPPRSMFLVQVVLFYFIFLQKIFIPIHSQLGLN